MDNRVETPVSDGLLRSCRRLVAVQENERRAMGAEVHGDLGQMLTALKLMLATPGLSGGGTETDEALAEARQLVSDLLERVRDLALQLRPPMLDDLGLMDTLDWYLERMTRQAGLSLEFHARGLEHRPGPDQETACFRVIQESVSNVVRHARARALTVRVSHASGELDFEVIDDGEGFELDTVRERARSGEGSGLDAMEARLMLLRGVLTVDSRPGNGTRVHGAMPAGNRRRSAGGAR